MTLNQKTTPYSINDLANSRTFEEQTKELLKFCTRTHAKAVMLFIAFDPQTNEINDQQHELVLEAIANRLLTKARDSDVYAYLGEMNFASLTVETSQEHVSILVEKLNNELAEPIELLDGPLIKLSAKIGIAEFPEQGDSYEQLINISSKGL